MSVYIKICHMKETHWFLELYLNPWPLVSIKTLLQFLLVWTEHCYIWHLGDQEGTLCHLKVCYEGNLQNLSDSWEMHGPWDEVFFSHDLFSKFAIIDHETPTVKIESMHQPHHIQHHPWRIPLMHWPRLLHQRLGLPCLMTSSSSAPPITSPNTKNHPLTTTYSHWLAWTDLNSHPNWTMWTMMVEVWSDVVEDFPEW